MVDSFRVFLGELVALVLEKGENIFGDGRSFGAEVVQDVGGISLDPGRVFGIAQKMDNGIEVNLVAANLKKRRIGCGG